MKTLGLTGGIDSGVTAEYYRLISLGIVHEYQRLTPRCVIWSCDYNEVRALHRARDEDGLAGLFVDAAVRLEIAGADLLLICGVAHHDLADEVQRGVSIPLLHVADPVAERLKSGSIGKAGLLDASSVGPGSYEGPLSIRRGIEVLVPTAAERAAIEWAEHLEFVVQSDPTARRKAYQAIVERMTGEGAQAILFERTDAMPHPGQGGCPVPLIDTIALHVDAAMTMALRP